MNTLELTPNIQKQIDIRVPALDIIHGELKNLMYEAENELVAAQEQEDRTEEAMDSMERKYWEGQLEAYAYLYSLTYAIGFAEQERDK